MLIFYLMGCLYSILFVLFAFVISRVISRALARVRTKNMQSCMRHLPLLPSFSLFIRSLVVAPMTSLRSTASCSVCPTPARALSCRNYFRLTHTLFKIMQRYYFFSFLPNFFAHFSQNAENANLRCSFLPAVLFALSGWPSV